MYAHVCVYVYVHVYGITFEIRKTRSVSLAWSFQSPLEKCENLVQIHWLSYKSKLNWHWQTDITKWKGSLWVEILPLFKVYEPL
jgi:hypothetical protein